MQTKNKRILVTGGAGFVGSNLCERLLREGHSVICADNLYTGSLDNIKEFLSQENFEFRQMDILDKAEVEKLKDLLIDEIYHWLVLLLLCITKRMPFIQLGFV